jgi:hypothetical protein
MMGAALTEFFPSRLTHTERLTLEAIERGKSVTRGRLDLVRKSGWVTVGKTGPRLTKGGQFALRDDL